MDLHSKFLKYLNDEATNLVGIIKELPEPKSPKVKTLGSLENKIPIDLTNKLSNTRLVLTSVTYTGKLRSIKECLGYENCIGFDEDSFPRFSKFLDNAYKDNFINKRISKKFLQDLSFEWLIKTFRSNEVSSNFANYLLAKIEEAVKKYKIYFPVLNIEIDRPFSIGQAKFEYFTREYFDHLENDFLKTKRESQENYFPHLRKQYQGGVFASIEVTAERDKAIELALIECSLSMDLLKIFCPTLVQPDYDLCFDIDSRFNKNISSEILIQNSNTPHEINLTRDGSRSLHTIDKKEWDRMLSLGLEKFNKFLFEKDSFDSEIKELLINSIKRLANSLSNQDINERIVELFTILESLLLKDKNSSILDNVCGYASRLVFKNIDDRKELIKLLKEMYEIRSNMIHHAIKTEFDLQRVTQFQIAILLLFSSLIEKVKLHKTKKDLLNSIDDVILSAY